MTRKNMQRTVSETYSPSWNRQYIIRSEFADHFATPACDQGTEDVHVDVLTYEPGAAVGQREMTAAGGNRNGFADSAVRLLPESTSARCVAVRCSHGCRWSPTRRGERLRA